MSARSNAKRVRAWKNRKESTGGWTCAGKPYARVVAAPDTPVQPECKKYPPLVEAERELMYSMAKAAGLSAVVNVCESGGNKPFIHAMIQTRDGERLIDYWPATRRFRDLVNKRTAIAADHQQAMVYAVKLVTKRF